MSTGFIRLGRLAVYFIDVPIQFQPVEMDTDPVPSFVIELNREVQASSLRRPQAGRKRMHNR